MHPMECEICKYRYDCRDRGCLRSSEDEDGWIDHIKAAAIHFVIPQPFGDPNHLIMTGKRHADIFENAFHQGIVYDETQSVQGFITDTYKFLDRYQAKRFALRNGQLKEDTQHAELYSEDLW